MQKTIFTLLLTSFIFLACSKESSENNNQAQADSASESTSNAPLQSQIEKIKDQLGAQSTEPQDICDALQLKLDALRVRANNPINVEYPDLCTHTPEAQRIHLVNTLTSIETKGGESAKNLSKLELIKIIMEPNEDKISKKDFKFENGTLTINIFTSVDYFNYILDHFQMNQEEVEKEIKTLHQKVLQTPGLEKLIMASNPKFTHPQGVHLFYLFLLEYIENNPAEAAKNILSISGTKGIELSSLYHYRGTQSKSHFRANEDQTRQELFDYLNSVSHTLKTYKDAEDLLMSLGEKYGFKVKISPEIATPEERLKFAHFFENYINQNDTSHFLFIDTINIAGGRSIVNNVGKITMFLSTMQNDAGEFESALKTLNQSKLALSLARSKEEMSTYIINQTIALGLNIVHFAYDNESINSVFVIESFESLAALIKENPELKTRFTKITLDDRLRSGGGSHDYKIKGDELTIFKSRLIYLENLPKDAGLVK